MDISECVYSGWYSYIQLDSQLLISCWCYWLLGGRHIIREDGLEFLNVTDSDAGNYTCRAEVDEFGNYAERLISVAVNSASFLVLFDFWGHIVSNVVIC